MFSLQLMLCIFSTFFLAAGCTFQVGSVDLHLIYTPDVLKNPLDSSRVRALRLTVTGRDLEPRSVVIQPAALGGIIDDVPVGLDRQVTIEGLDTVDEVVSRGVSEPFDNDGGGRTIFVYFSLTGKFSGPPLVLGDSEWSERFRTDMSIQERFLHAAARLPSGQVLITGGALAPAAEDFTGPVTNSLRSMDILDGYAAAFVNDGPFADCINGISCLRTARAFHQSVLLEDGEHVILAGGEPSDPQNPVELYEVQNSTFWKKDFPQGARNRVAAATAGSQLAVAGGMDPVTGSLSAEVDIYAGGSFRGYPDLLSEPRAGAVAVALEGEPPAVLVVGGWKTLGAPAEWQASDAVDRIELGGSQPTVTSFKLQHARADHTAVALTGAEKGLVLICGGRSSATVVESSCELRDAAGTIYEFPPTVNRWAHTCTVTADGQILVAGGFERTSQPLQALSTAVIFRPSGNLTPVSMLSPRAGHTATLLPNGMVALVGGISWYQGTNIQFPQFDYEIFNP